MLISDYEIFSLFLFQSLTEHLVNVNCMDIENKLIILADSAKYDVSCASSGSTRQNTGGIGNAFKSGICHAWSADGRCVSLLKILLSNQCVYDCLYCVNRCSNDIRRTTFSPDEVADLTIHFYRRNYIEGLFLSTGVIRDPDYTMELMIKALSKLRNVYQFNGYIHVKVIPGSDQKLIQQLGLLADRMSINIELPSRQSLRLLAPQKNKEGIISPMKYMRDLKKQNQDEKKKLKNTPQFNSAGMSTQLIIGATPESDLTILNLSENLYNKMNLKRVYYSAYVPIADDSLLPALLEPPLLREHRLYQADWLLRFYGFQCHELLDNRHPNFDYRFDPKTSWALKHIDIFPLEVNKASYEELLKIPGIGVRSAQKIIQARRSTTLREADLKKIGVVLKRARHFICANGNYMGGKRLEPLVIEKALLPAPPKKKRDDYQLSLFQDLEGNDRSSAVSGEL